MIKLPGFKSKKTLFFCAAFVISIAILAYCISVVIIARKHTPTLVAELLKSKTTVLNHDDLTQRQIDILLKVQDPNFYNHNGVDLKTPGAGITTLTQALVKKTYFKKFKPGIRKLKQTLIARFALDSLVPKDYQLQIFINIAYLGNVNGNQVKGFSEAAQEYYGKPFSELSEDEYISIVALLIAPDKYNIKNRPEANANRTAAIKRLISGEYTPEGLMDLYYGGKTYRKKKGFIKNKLTHIVWGY